MAAEQSLRFSLRQLRSRVDQDARELHRQLKPILGAMTPSPPMLRHVVHSNISYAFDEQTDHVLVIQQPTFGDTWIDGNHGEHICITVKLGTKNITLLMEKTSGVPQLFYDAVTKIQEMELKSDPAVLYSVASDLYRKAAVEAVKVTFKDTSGHGGVFGALQTLGNTAYESDDATGFLTICDPPPDMGAIGTIHFSDRIPLNEVKRVRKYLAAATNKKCVLGVSPGNHPYAWGYTPLDESKPYIQFLPRQTWKLVDGIHDFVSSRGGIRPVLHEGREETMLRDRFCHTFHDGDVEEAVRLMKLAQHQVHGTMLVFSQEAEKEADRLRMQSTCLKRPLQRITEEQLLGVSSMDGAILLDCHGNCHAIGVILDGLASNDVGDSSRGARYNSALKYAAGKKVIIVCISEDGPMDIISEIVDIKSLKRKQATSAEAKDSPFGMLTSSLQLFGMFTLSSATITRIRTCFEGIVSLDQELHISISRKPFPPHAQSIQYEKSLHWSGVSMTRLRMKNNMFCVVLIVEGGETHRLGVLNHYKIQEERCDEDPFLLHVSLEYNVEHDSHHTIPMEHSIDIEVTGEHYVPHEPT